MASKTKAQERMDALLTNPGIKRTLMDYFTEQLRDNEAKFIKTTKDMFEVHKGRCVELDHIIKYLESN